MQESFADLAARYPDYAAWLTDLSMSAKSGESQANAAAGGVSSSARAKFASTVILPEMLAVPTGHFTMGAHPADPDRRSDESPRREISIKTFEASCTPITFEQWEACLADGGTKHRPEDNGWGRGTRPVINVSWHDAQEYIDWLNFRLDLPPENRFRLLSEAEWEYAARAGHDGERFPWGEDLDGRQLQHHAWYYANSEGRTQPVGNKPANAFGLFDMLGNVAEWVQDHYSSDYRPHGNDGRPFLEDARHANRVIRGGSWLDPVRMLRPSARESMNPNHRSYKIGFRVARSIREVFP